ncbi:MAG: hypothetical protein EXR62_10800 [Chloroflexi bacterium]|nr:hypothetical protein [Chloroflexota bacterium]
MTDQPQAVDLKDHLHLGVDHIYAGLDRKRGCRPYFRFQLVQNPVWAQHESGDTPHVVGRFLDALSRCARIIDMPQDEEADKDLASLLYASLVGNNGFAWDDMAMTPGKAPYDRPLAVMHHQREVLLGLIALASWKNEERALHLAQQLVQVMEQATRETRGYPGSALSEQGWVAPRQDGSYSPANDSGRTLGALVRYYRMTADSMALEVARRFADYNREVCFTQEGQLTPLAGTHLHSIEGTITGLIDFGLLINDRSYLDFAKRIYDVGLVAWRTSYGWAKESRKNEWGRGEANNTTDFIEAALLLGQAGYPQYYEDAERFLRNGLLPCQLIDVNWIQDNEGLEDTWERAYRDLRRRARGGFCFATPNDFHSYNTDLTGGALQGICESWAAIFSEDQTGVRVNLLLNKESESLSLRSYLPNEGRLEIHMHKNRHLWVRLPSWLKTEKIRLRVDRETAPLQLQAPYLFLPALKAGTAIEITFPLARQSMTEQVIDRSFQVEWLGDTVVSISPRGIIAPRYG